MNIAEIGYPPPHHNYEFLSAIVTLQKRVLVLNFIQKHFTHKDCSILVGASGMIETVCRTSLSGPRKRRYQRIRIF